MTILFYNKDVLFVCEYLPMSMVPYKRIRTGLYGTLPADKRIRLCSCESKICIDIGQRDTFIPSPDAIFY